MIRGVTLTHPWAYCIAHAGKDIENRSWHPSRQGGQVGMYLAIHGGAVPGPNTAKREEVRMDLSYILSAPPSGSGLPRISPSALMTLALGRQAEGEEKFFIPGIVAVARLAGVVRDSSSAWAVEGQHHWQLADLLTLPEPIPHRGAQGLWEVQPETLAQLRELWKRRDA